MSSGIEVGKATERDGGKFHAIRSEAAACSHARKILTVGRTDLNVTTSKTFCGTRACRKAIREQIEAAKAANVTESSGPRRWRAENALIALAEIFESVADKAFRDRMVARLATPVSPIFPAPVAPVVPVVEDTLFQIAA